MYELYVCIYIYPLNLNLTYIYISPIHTYTHTRTYIHTSPISERVSAPVVLQLVLQGDGPLTCCTYLSPSSSCVLLCALREPYEEFEDEITKESLYSAVASLL